MSARARWLSVLVWLVPATASAQVVDLGTVRVEVPRPARLDDFVVAGRLEVPRVGRADVPASAAAALDAYAEAQDQARRALVALHDASTPGPDGAHTAAYAAARARVDRDVAREEAAGAALRDALAAHEDTLGRPALSCLGMLRFHDARARFERAMTEVEACLARPGADCPDPVMDDGAALATWARVSGSDVVAAWSLYERALSLSDHGADAEARRALEEALAIAALPPELEAHAAFALGELRERELDPHAQEAFARCASVASDPIAPHCALRAGAAGEGADALAMLAPWLDHPEVGTEARRVTAEIFARGAELPALDAIPAPVRARVLAIGAERLAAEGRTTQATAAVETARSLAPSPTLDALATRVAATRTTETAETWLRRTARFCAQAAGTAFDGQWRLRVRATRRGARIAITSPPMAPTWTAVTACLERAPLAPEAPFVGSFRATLVVDPVAGAD